MGQHHPDARQTERVPHFILLPHVPHSILHRRAANHAGHLLELISKFPKVNPSSASTEDSDVDIPKLFRQIRSRYKALCSSIGVKASLRASSADGENDEVDQAKDAAERQKIWRLEPTAQEQLSF